MTHRAKIPDVRAEETFGVFGRSSLCLILRSSFPMRRHEMLDRGMERLGGGFVVAGQHVAKRLTEMRVGDLVRWMGWIRDGVCVERECIGNSTRSDAACALLIRGRRSLDRPRRSDNRRRIRERRRSCGCRRFRYATAATACRRNWVDRCRHLGVLLGAELRLIGALEAGFGAGLRGF